MIRAYAFAAAAALFLCSCAAPNRESVSLDPSLESLVPSDTTFILVADIDRIKDTALYRKVLKDVQFPQLNEFVQQTGVDPRKDLDKLVSVSNGKAAALIARGRFNQRDLEPRFQGRGAQRFGYKNYTLFGNENGAVLFVSQTVAAMGSTSILKQIIDARENKGGHGVPVTLKEQMRHLPATDQIWVAMTGLNALDLGIPRNTNLASAAQLLKGVQTFRLGVDVSNGLKAAGVVSCDSEENAKHIHDALKGIIGLGRLNTPDNQPDLLKLYDAVQVTQVGQAIDVKAEIAPDLVDRFVDLWLKRR